MKKSLKFAAFFCAVFSGLLSLTGCGPDNSKQIVMVCEATFPPYEFREGDKIVGIDADIMREVAKELNKELLIEDMSFDSVISAVSTGKADVAASGITVTEERKRQVFFSESYVSARQVIIVPKKSAINSKAQLKGKRIGVQHGTTGDLYVTKNFQEPERYQNGALAIAALDAGKLDAVVLDGEPAKIHVSQGTTNRILAEPLTIEEYAIAISKKNAPLLKELNRILKAMKQDGRLAQIRAKYQK